MSSPRTFAAGVAGLALTGTGLAVATAPGAVANPAGTGLVISEVYGGGGNSGATYTHDFIELYNPTRRRSRWTGCRCSTAPPAAVAPASPT